MITDQFNNDLKAISAQNQIELEKQQIMEKEAEKKDLHEFFLENHEPWLIKSSINNMVAKSKKVSKNITEKIYKRSKYYDIKPIIINRKPNEFKKEQTKKENLFDLQYSKKPENNVIKQNFYNKNQVISKIEKQEKRIVLHLKNQCKTN
ncbi:hypothetical protein EDEG_03968 [Edhazardia aedis USNM 41457]|uniref:Uncharacterized protein n=1 Tax=Edhazardia aedis (strain USNM 41457) TaxID=1003232 RepID=J9D0I6_EDHAE|nr:hypothetical protein EDEG_03968 [Edhazardia aedis USNM 41457]|eukprot:EJW01406.1 hypothetical protein EDEG_03968 [Edhazardia aedis USNM 41457]